MGLNLDPEFVIDGRDPVSVGRRFYDKPIFVKTGRVRALRLTHHVDVNTPEGTMGANAGDYLVADEEMTHCWPVKMEVFEATYEQVEDAQS
jgi:hypothetical protein